LGYDLVPACKGLLSAYAKRVRLERGLVVHGCCASHIQKVFRSKRIAHMKLFLLSHPC
jgi:hypothetical protein